MLENSMNEPIRADFNSRDEDDAVRIFPPLATLTGKPIDSELLEGDVLWISDGEIEMHGKVTYRDGIWVVIPDINGFGDLDENSPFHNDRIK